MNFSIDNAVLQYAERSPGVLDMYHTEVPGTMQGRGIGKILAKVICYLNY